MAEAKPVSTHLPYRDLPTEQLDGTSVRGLAWVVLAPLLLVLGVNLAVAEVLARHPNNRGNAVTARKWDLLAGLSNEVDTLMVGDSSCNQGLVPEVMAKQLGGRALNLCTTGDSGVVGDAWMVSAYVRRFGAPKRVIVMHAYDVWQRSDDAMRRQAWILGQHRGLFLGEAPELAWSTRERVMLVIGRFVPLYAQPTAARQVLRDPVAALSRPPFVITEDGFMPTRNASPRRVARDARSHARSSGRRSFKMPDTTSRALAELTRLSREHAFPLFVIHAPLYEKLWQHRGLRRYHGQVSAQLERALAAAPHAKLLSRTPPMFPAKRMENADHVVGAAAHELSQAIASSISEQEAKWAAP